MKVPNSLHVIIVSATLALAGCSDNGSDFTAYFDGDADTASAHDLGVYHFATGQFGLAVQYFERAADRNPRAIESVNGLAAAYDRLGRFDLAERQYRRALSIDPLSVQTLNNLGYSYWLQGRYDLALTYLREAEELDGSNSVIATNLKNVVEAYQREGALAEVAKPKEPERVEQAKLPVPVRETWIERTAPNVQTLVTRPAMTLLAAAQRSDLPPQLLSYQGAAEEPPISFVFETEDTLVPPTLGKSRQPTESPSGSDRSTPRRRSERGGWGAFAAGPGGKRRPRIGRDRQTRKPARRQNCDGTSGSLGKPVAGAAAGEDRARRWSALRRAAPGAAGSPSLYANCRAGHPGVRIARAGGPRTRPVLYAQRWRRRGLDALCGR